MTEAEVLVRSIRSFLNERYGPYNHYPENLRLEMHPTLEYPILRDVELAKTRGRFGSLSEFFSGIFGVPCTRNAELPERSWRLVIVTEEVLTGGKLS